MDSILVNVFAVVGVLILMGLAYTIGYLTAENNATKERIADLEAEKRARSPHSYGPWAPLSAKEIDA